MHSLRRRVSVLLPIPNSTERWSSCVFGGVRCDRLRRCRGGCHSKRIARRTWASIVFPQSRFAIAFLLTPRRLAQCNQLSCRVVRFVYGGDRYSSRWQTQVNDIRSQIRQCTLAHVESFSLWINATIVEDSPPDPAALARIHAVDPALYRRIRIEMYLPEELRDGAVQSNSSTPDYAMELHRFLEGPWAVVVTCSATDVVAVDWPGVY